MSLVLTTDEEWNRLKAEDRERDKGKQALALWRRWISGEMNDPMVFTKYHGIICIFCRKEQPVRGVDHEPDCVYAAAYKLVGGDE